MLHQNGLYRSLFFAAVLAAFVTIGFAGEKSDKPVEKEMGMLVTTQWLSDHLDDADLVVLDCSVTMTQDEKGGLSATCGCAAFKAGHIPTAGFADLMGELSGADSQMSFVLPTPEQFCDAMGALGVGDDSKVVLYDNFNSAWASRVWWMLRWVGFDRVALLDGGLRAWKAEKRPLSTEPATRKPAKLTCSVRPELIAHQDDVLAAIKDDAVTIIDVMPPAHFQGKMAMYGRPGHIPSAINIPSMALLDDTGRFKPKEELQAMFTGDAKARFITYCGAGVAASENAYVMELLGFSNVAVYMGSLQEWAADPANPLIVESAEVPCKAKESAVEDKKPAE